MTTPPPPEHPTSLQTFWRALTQFDSNKIKLWMGLRNAVGIVLPLAVAVYLGHPGSGLIAATGALNVAVGDGVDSYRSRALRMVVASVLCALAVFIGALSARNGFIVIALSTLLAFAAGLLVSLGAAVENIATVSLVVFIVFSAQSLVTPADAAWSGLIALGGGLVQTLLSIALWPIRGFQPERRIIADFYGELARAANLTPIPNDPALATAQSTQSLDAMSSLSGDHRIEAERLFMLINQAERIRITLFALGRSLVRLRREEGSERVVDSIERFLECASSVLSSVSHALQDETLPESASVCPKEVERAIEAVRQAEDDPSHSALQPYLTEGRLQMDALAGQLRAALELARSASSAGEAAFAEREARTPWSLQLTGWLATLKANLSLDSSSCRHAIRLALCIAIGDIIARGFSLPRSYWLAMTIALVLKPDFGNTVSRGVLRLAGTYTGLMLATVVFHFFAPSVPASVLAIGILSFIQRSLGLANYGILVTAISSLIVFLFSVAGIAPKDVIAARALNSTIGGALALAIYWVWPTRERTQAPHALAGLFDAYRLDFQAVARDYFDGRSIVPQELDRLRMNARRARSNVETSVDRLAAEPFTDPEQLRILNAILASARRFIHAVLAIEASLSPEPSAPPPEEFQAFAHDVEKTFFFLAARLRGSPVAPTSLPNLREDHHRLIHAGNNLERRKASLNIETDRMTNSLNTLSELVFRWVNHTDQGFTAS